MLRRPPISTRTDTLFPYTTLFRSTPINGGARTAMKYDIGSRIRLSRRVMQSTEFSSGCSDPDAGSRDVSGQRMVSYSQTRARRPKIWRSEEHTSELQSLMRISYAVFCLKKHTTTNTDYTCHQ